MVVGSERNIKLNRYPQEFAATVGEAEGLGLGQVRCALASEGRVWLGGEGGVAAIGPEGTMCEAGQVEGAVLDLCWARGALHAAGGKGLVVRREGGWQPVVGEWGEIQAIAGSPELLVVAGGEALYVLGREGCMRTAYPRAAEVREVALGPEGEIYLATSQGLWRREASDWRVFGEAEGHAGMASQDARAVFVDKFGHAWVGTAAGIEILDGHDWWERIQGRNGLCYEEVTCLAPLDSGRLWIGTGWGLIRLDGHEWHYYAGRRWLADDRVLAVAALDDAVYAVTPAGVSKIYTRLMTLEEKAAHFEARIQKRHYRMGYVADTHLEAPGDTEHFIHEATDNDGLWTALYVAAESYRYGATRDPAARKLASTSLQALLELQRKCSLPGYVARALVRKGEARTVKSGGEWHDSADGEYEWKGDTSSDEIDGHLYAYSVYCDLVADEEEKRQIAEVTAAFMDYILDNGYLLIDVDGKPTRWGVWAPSMLNGSSWEPERGLNSLEMLSHLRAAHHMTGKQRYLDAYHDLVRNHHFALNTIYQKILIPEEVNHSDDELAFCAYHPLLAYEDDPELRRLYLFSFELSWQIEQPEHSAWCNYMYGALTGKAFDVEESVKMLRDAPMELVCWTMKNSQRADLPRDAEAGRFREPQSLRALPADERGAMKWNSNPYRLDDGGGGRREDDGAFFLLPYWMGRYYGFIKE